MNWSKSGKNYSVKCDGNKTIYNLDGTVVSQPTTSQEDAVSFLRLNGYVGFEVDKPVVKKKSFKDSEE